MYRLPALTYVVNLDGISILRFLFVSGGNQRDLARAKRQKAEKGKAKDAGTHSANKGKSLDERKQRFV